jgi:hypothetical protein
MHSTRHRAAILAFIAPLAACDGDSGDCASLRDDVARENCLFERVSASFQAQDPKWRRQLAAIASPDSRDLVRLRLAILDPQQGPTICAEVETASAKDRCQRVVGRPHLASPPRPEDPR